MRSGSPDGAIETSGTLHNDRAGYYGHPMIKPPEWTALIPIYFWAGGMSGASMTLALTQRVRRNDPLARTLIFGAAAGTALSASCLIFDLKKPARFMNMLRVFKPTSPMSMGTYIISVFGGATMTAAACEFTGMLTPLARAAETLAGITGPVMSVYTAVLISDTVVPAWFLARKSMPAVFGATSASTAGALGMLFGTPQTSGSARRLAIAGGSLVPFMLHRLHEELGPVQAKPYKEGRAGTLAHAAKIMNVAGVLCAVLGGKAPILSRLAGALLLAGGLAERFAIKQAGQQSASDPAFTINAQQPAATR